MSATVLELPLVLPQPDGMIAAHLDHCRLRNLRPTTVRARAWYLQRAEQIMGVPLAAATEGDLRDWQRTLRTLAVKSQIVALSHIRSFYAWAVAMRHVDTDPTRTLIRPRTPRMLPRPIDGADLALAIGAADPTVRIVLILAAYCGLRACEIAGLTTDALHGDDTPPFLEVREGKGGHQRIVPLPRQVYDELRLYGLSRGAVVRRRDGSGHPLSPAAVSVAANTHMHRLGITATLHQARHFYGTRMYDLSLDLRAVGAVMGHADIGTTAGYVQFSERSAADAAARLGKTLGCVA